MKNEKLVSLIYYGITASVGSELGAFNSAILMNEFSQFTTDHLAAEFYFLTQASSAHYLPIRKEIWNMLGENYLHRGNNAAEKSFVKAAGMNFPRAYFNLSQMRSIS